MSMEGSDLYTPKMGCAGQTTPAPPPRCPRAIHPSMSINEMRITRPKGRDKTSSLCSEDFNEPRMENLRTLVGRGHNYVILTTLCCGVIEGSICDKEHHC